MARGDYTPEIRTSIGGSPKGRLNTSPPKDSPAEIARDKARGISQSSVQDARLDAASAKTPPPRMPPHMANAGVAPPDAHHVAAATSIAHAILNKGSGGGY